jgi:hypothetical protein
MRRLPGPARHGLGDGGDSRGSLAPTSPGSIGMQDRQLITPSMTLLSHGTSMPAECPGHECRANSQSRSPSEDGRHHTVENHTAGRGSSGSSST